MNPHMTPAEISRFLERTLLRVQKPARYTGGEWNSTVKEWDAIPQRVAGDAARDDAVDQQAMYEGRKAT